MQRFFKASRISHFCADFFNHAYSLPTYFTPFGFLAVRPDGQIIFAIFGHLQQRKIAQWLVKIAKSGTKFSKILT